MKNAEFIMAAFLNCCLVEKNNLFTETSKHKIYWERQMKIKNGLYLTFT